MKIWGFWIVLFAACTSQAGEWTYAIHDGKKWGLIDETGAWVVKPRFDAIFPLASDKTYRQAERNEKFGLIDATGKWFVRPRFDRLYPAELNPGETITVVHRGKEGLLHGTEGLVLKPEFDGVEASREQRVWIRDGETARLFDTETLDWIGEGQSCESSWDLPRGFESGFSWMFDPERKVWSCFLRNGFRLPFNVRTKSSQYRSEDPKYDPDVLEAKDSALWMAAGDEQLLVTEGGEVLARIEAQRILPWNISWFKFQAPDGRWGLLDEDGAIRRAAEFKSINGFAGSVVWGGPTLWTVLGDEGQQIAPPGKYFEIGETHEGMTAVRKFVPQGRTRFEQLVWGFIDRDGDEVVKPAYYRIHRFSEGLAAVTVQFQHGQYMNYFRYGAIDTAGEMVIKPDYVSIRPFYRGRSWALKPGSKSGPSLWVMIDREGNRLTDWIPGRPDSRTYSGGKPRGWFNPEDRVVGSFFETGGNTLAGLVRADGSEVLPPIYHYFRDLGEGRFMVSRKYEEPFNNRPYWFGEGLLDEAGRILVEPTLSRINPFDGGVAWFLPKAPITGWGLMGRDGTVLAEPRFQARQWSEPKFEGPLAAVADNGEELWKYDHRRVPFGYVNRKGEIVAWTPED
ncbi:MAG: hypothetical protein ACI8UO_000040 [Verrucomicrobiales bacterium]|jgi:hypothetical protein